MPNIAYQLYCSRTHDIADVLPMLARLGYSQVEGWGGLYATHADLADLLKANDLTMPTGHFGLQALEGDPVGTVAKARELGIDVVIVPAVGPELRRQDAGGWAALGGRLAEAAKPVLDAGMTFAWHNHDFEFADLGGEDLPLDLILQGSEDIGLEIDLAWVERGGQDPLAWARKYKDRLVAAHIKDIAPAGENADEDGWADVGHGTMNWSEIHPALQAMGVDRYILEHDKPSDHERFARRSLETVKGWL